MRAPLFIVPVLFTLLIPGCASKRNTKTEAQPPSDNSASRSAKKTTPKAKAAKTEVATGDLREALVHLRRVHFALDTAKLLPEARFALGEAAENLQARPDVHIYIDGHTDMRGTTEYNLALGDRRARAVSDYLMRLGIAKERLHTITFGREQPWDNGGSQLAHAKNRRAEFRMFRGNVRLVLDDGVLYNDAGEKISTR